MKQNNTVKVVYAFKITLSVMIVMAGMMIASCTKKTDNVPQDPQSLLADKGRKTYIAHCIACHNIDPKKDGAVGPAIWGSSLELLEAKVLRGEYPAGYKPKRETKAMAILPFIKDDLSAIHAFLQN